jgi:hypothetical protein
MYFAQMYCYGKSPMRVGITGFKSCIGMVYVSTRHLYAIHIPFTSNSLDGAANFATYIRTEQAQLGATGFLYVFTNGNMRGDSVNVEATLLKSNLGNPYTTLLRLKNIGTAVVLVRREVSRQTNVKLYVKDDENVTWLDQGRDRAACYDQRFAASFATPKNPSTSTTGWNEITTVNSDIIHVR